VCAAAHREIVLDGSDSKLLFFCTVDSLPRATGPANHCGAAIRLRSICAVDRAARFERRVGVQHRGPRRHHRREQWPRPMNVVAESTAERSANTSRHRAVEGTVPVTVCWAGSTVRRSGEAGYLGRYARAARWRPAAGLALRRARRNGLREAETTLPQSVGDRVESSHRLTPRCTCRAAPSRLRITSDQGAHSINCRRYHLQAHSHNHRRARLAGERDTLGRQTPSPDLVI
jgi:hypothetical protein